MGYETNRVKIQNIPPPFALVLSGGGARGAAHVGILKGLLEAGLWPEMIAGTSAGGVVTGLYASGMDIASMERMVKHLTQHGKEYLDPDYGAMLEFMPRLLAGRRIALSGLIKGEKLQEYFCDLTGRKHLDEAECPFLIPAVDLNSGDTIVFTNCDRAGKLEHVRWEWEGYLCQAMMASASVPAVFAPRKVGEYLLADGGITDNLPVNILKTVSSLPVVAVDLGGRYERPQDTSIIEIVSHSFSIMSSRLKECSSDGNGEKGQPILLLKPLFNNKTGLLDFDQMEGCMEEGYMYMKEMLPAVHRMLFK